MNGWRCREAKQGYCIYRVRVKRGDRKKRVAKERETTRCLEIMT